MPLPANLLKNALSLIVRQLPKLWPLLLEAKNRELVMKYSRDLADKAPGRRLAAHVNMTVELAGAMVTRAGTEAERAQAQAWTRRATALRDRLALPVLDHKRDHRKMLEADLKALHAEMSQSLSSTSHPDAEA